MGDPLVDGTALWLGAHGFDVRDVVEAGDELVVVIETSDVSVGCAVNMWALADAVGEVTDPGAGL